LTGPPTARLPNFFLAGAPKAGTTSLYFYLDQHPQIYMAGIKEPAFFGAADLRSGPYRDSLQRYLGRHGEAIEAYLRGPQERGAKFAILEWQDYLRLFRDVRDETAIGEASVDYFWQPSAPAAIHAKLPAAKLIFVLRDPAELLLTRYLASPSRDRRTTFREWFLEAQRSPTPWIVPLGPGRIATNLERFFGLFGRDQIRVYLYHEYRADPRALLRDVFAFLGVDPAYPVDLTRRYNETPVPRFPGLHAWRQRVFGTGSATGWLPSGVRRLIRRAYNRPRGRMALDAADRRLVVDYYRDEIARAAELIGRDLSAWLR